MANLKRTLEIQQEVMKAAKEIIDHFQQFASYSDHIESMASAQTSIMLLYEYYNASLLKDPEGSDYVNTETITNFLWEVSQVYALVKPFAKLVGQIDGTREEVL